METLTEKQKRLLEFIESYFDKHDHSPTYEQIREHFDLSSKSTVQHYLKILKEKGYLNKNTRNWNSLQLSFDFTEVPLMGKVAAGLPLQHLKYGEKINIPKDMAREKEKLFALQVVGDSMIEEGILENDYVIIRKQESANNGEVVVALIDNEATIKYFYQKKQRIELHSANPKYKPIVIPENSDFKIAGIFKGLIRKAR